MEHLINNLANAVNHLIEEKRQSMEINPMENSMFNDPPEAKFGSAKKINKSGDFNFRSQRFSNKDDRLENSSDSGIAKRRTTIYDILTSGKDLNNNKVQYISQQPNIDFKLSSTSVKAVIEFLKRSLKFMSQYQSFKMAAYIEDKVIQKLISHVQAIYDVGNVFEDEDNEDQVQLAKKKKDEFK
jgi:hypothetical protein